MFWMVSDASLSWRGEWHLGITNSIELRPSSHSSPTSIHYHLCHLANTAKKKTHGRIQRVCPTFYLLYSENGSAICILALCHLEEIQCMNELASFFMNRKDVTCLFLLNSIHWISLCLEIIWRKSCILRLKEIFCLFMLLSIKVLWWSIKQLEELAKNGNFYLAIVINWLLLTKQNKNRTLLTYDSLQLEAL